MSRFSNPLSHVRVASPCPADWNSMIGDERVRFCGQCELKVYNLSAMTKTQAEDLICGTEGRLCVRFYRRRDGSILTQDCPVGLARLRQRMSRIRRAVVASALGFMAGISGTLGLQRFEKLVLDSFDVRPQVTTGMMVEPAEPIVRGPVAGQMELGKRTFQGRDVWPKKRRQH